LTTSWSWKKIDILLLRGMPTLWFSLTIKMYRAFGLTHGFSNFYVTRNGAQ
jgi:hypothetical protein